SVDPQNGVIDRSQVTAVSDVRGDGDVAVDDGKGISGGSDRSEEASVARRVDDEIVVDRDAEELHTVGEAVRLRTDDDIAGAERTVVFGADDPGNKLGAALIGIGRGQPEGAAVFLAKRATALDLGVHRHESAAPDVEGAFFSVVDHHFAARFDRDVL